MKGLNTNIHLYLPDMPTQVEKYRYAFDNKNEAKAIDYLKKLYFNHYRYKTRRAVIYKNDEIIFVAVDGLEITGKEGKKNEKGYFFGKDISRFKLKVLDENNTWLAYYSNTIIEENYGLKAAYYDQINWFVKKKHYKDFKAAVVFDISGEQEIEVAKWKFNYKTRNFEQTKNKEYHAYNEVFN